MSSARSVLRMVPMIIIMGTIFFLSHQHGDDLPVPDIPFFDKACHFIIYGLLAISILFAFTDQLKKGREKFLYIAALVFCLLFGLSDEYHQSFIAGRYSSGADLLADFLGALGFLLLFGKRIVTGVQSGVVVKLD